MSLPVLFYVLAWISASPDKAEHELFFGNHFDSKIECLTRATEFQEQVKGKKLKLAYSRFICVPVPGEPTE